MDSPESLHVQAKIILEAGYTMNDLTWGGIIFSAPLPPEKPAPEYSLAEQARLLAEANYHAEPPEELPEEPPALAKAEAAAKIAVYATFDPAGVALKEGDRERTIPYVGQAGRLRANPRALASARCMVSYAVLGSPDRLFHRADIEALSVPLNGSWRNTHEDLRTWWRSRLRVNGHALIVPGERGGHGVRANPRLAVTVSESKTPSGKKMAR
jgi:hypothetical protein